MSKRDLLSLDPISAEEIEWLILRAKVYKKGGTLQPLKGYAVGLAFEKVSTRTRVSFEVAILRLGGHPIFLSFDDLQIKRGEPIADTARVLSGYLNGLVIRTYEHEKLLAWGASATVPVINGLTDRHHPCQALSDLFTIYERKKKLKGLKLAYIGDGNNVAHSLLEAGARVGMKVAVASPKGFGPDPEIVKSAEEMAKKHGGSVSVEEDPYWAVEEADIVYTDVWVSMGQEKEKQKREKRFKPYQINQTLLASARPDCLVMHCLPANRDEEITSDVMDGPRSIIFEQAENRLPMHQAILERWIGAQKDSK